SFSRDWSSDVCSSDLATARGLAVGFTLSKTDDQLLTQLTHRQGVDSVVDCLATDVIFFKGWDFHRAQLTANLLRGVTFTQHVDHQTEQFLAGYQLAPRAAAKPALPCQALGVHSSVAASRQAVTLQLSADRQWAAVELSSDLPLAHALQASNFNGRAFFNIEFCVCHAHTLPEVRCCTQFLPPPFLHKDAIWR